MHQFWRGEQIMRFLEEALAMIGKLLVIAGALVGALSQSAFAQFYKGKTITMIINYPAGGPSDIEGRIVAQHLPSHIPGKPTIVIRNVGGAGGVIVGNPAIRVSYTDFVLLAGIENPVVVYARKDTPPGLRVATDIMQAKDFKALSLNVQNSNTVNLALMLDLLRLDYQAVPAYRGLKEVETAIMQNLGQLANTSLPGWTGSIEPTMSDIVLPLWQLSARDKDRTYPRSRALPNLPTFEEFYAMVRGGSKPSGIMYEALRAGSDPQLAMFRTALMPPKTLDEAVVELRTAFIALGKDPQFLRDYSNIVKTDPILVSGEEGQQFLAAVGKIRPELKTFISDYSSRLVK
jgi:hypothetical protein